jgi:glycosyltransferase involved in cell wall biosynthesis
MDEKKFAVLNVIGCHSTQYGSFEDFLIAMSEECQKRKIKSIFLYPAIPKSRSFLQKLKSCSEVVIMEGKWKLDPIFCLKLSKLISEKNIRVIHSHWTPTAYNSTLSGYFKGVKKIFLTKHDSFTSFYHSKFYKWISSICDRIFCVTSKIKNDLKAIGIPEEKLMVAFPGVNLRRFKPIPGAKQKLLKTLNMPCDSYIILSASHARPGKGLEFLIESASRVLPSIPNAYFIFLGDGPLLGKLKSQSKKLGIEKRVIFTGAIEDVSSFLAACDIFVFPPSSQSEGIGLSGIEAMACEKPIIATSVGEYPLLIENWRNGVIVPPKDSVAIAKALIELLKAQELREKLGREARRAVSKKFNLNRTASFVVDFYELAREGSNGG